MYGRCSNLVTPSLPLLGGGLLLPSLFLLTCGDLISQWQVTGRSGCVPQLLGYGIWRILGASCWLPETSLGCPQADSACVRAHTVGLCPLTVGPRRLPGMVSAPEAPGLHPIAQLPSALLPFQDTHCGNDLFLSLMGANDLKTV